MKKINTFLSAALFTALAVSCAKETLQETNQSNRMTIEVSSEGSRTALDGTNVVWNAGDAISVLYGSSNQKFTTAAGGATASFSGEASPAESDAVFAVYPYSEYNKIEDGKLKVIIPSVQVGVPDSFAEGANVTVGKISEGKVQMKNIGGLIKLPIAGSDITSVTLRSANVVPLTGDFLVDCSGELPVTTAMSTSNEVKLVPAAGKTTLDAGTYYIAVASVAMTGGFELVYTKEAARGVKKTANSCTVARAHILPIAAQDASISFIPGRFVEFVASSYNEADRWWSDPVQPFTTKLNTGTGSSATPSTGSFYQNCPEQYMYTIINGETEKAGGYILNTGAGYAGLYYLNKAYLVLPSFAHKTLKTIDYYSVVSSSGAPIVDGKTIDFYIHNKDLSSIGKGSPMYLGCNYKSGSNYFGLCYVGYDVPETAKEPIALRQSRIKKMTLFYAGEDVEEVTSVNAEVPSEIITGTATTVEGSFKSWNYGTGATYVAGIEYKPVLAADWKSVTGTVTGRNFTADIPATLDPGNYVCRTWAGVDGVNGAKVYGAEKTFAVTGVITHKTLTYNFLEGEPDTWTSETPAVWPFDAASKTQTAGTVVTVTDSFGYQFTLNLTNCGKGELVKGRGWRVNTTKGEGDFYLEFPSFAGLKLVSVSVTAKYDWADKIGIADSTGKIIDGGAVQTPKIAGTQNSWTLSNTEVGAKYRFVNGTNTQGRLLEITGLTLEYRAE